MSRSHSPRRVVITGLGAVTAMGRGAKTTWDGILAGQSGIRARHPFGDTSHPPQACGYVDLACLQEVAGDAAAARCGLGRAARFGLAAGVDAWNDATFGASAPDPHEAGVCLGASTFPVIEDRLDRLGDLLDNDRWNAPRYAELCRERPWLLTQSDAASISTLLSDRLGLEGPSLTLQAACTSATQAIGHAFGMLRAGNATVMLAGGTDSMVSLMCVTGFELLGSLAQRWTSPAQASRPFDRTRDGFVLAEGAAVLVLERLDHALSRNARIYAELIGYGSSCDAFRFTDMHPEGQGAVSCMQAALKNAQVKPEEVGYINAHGTATPLNDRIETHAIRQVFGSHATTGLAVSSTKSQLGHLLCAAGAIELALTALALHDQILPPTLNLEHPDAECDLDYIPGVARSAAPDAAINVAMSNSFGFGGQNGSLVLRRWSPPAPSQNVPRATTARPRIVITGMGICSPLGLNLPTHLAQWRGGNDAVTASSTPEMIALGILSAGRVRNFNASHFIRNRMLRKILTPAAGFAVAAAGEALAASGLSATEVETLSLFVGSLGLDQDLNSFAEALSVSLEPATSKSGESAERFSYTRFMRYGTALIDPLFLVKSLPNAGLCGAAIEHDMRGPNLNIMNGSTSGLLAVSAATDAILSGETRVALAGGYDSLVQFETVLTHLIEGRLQVDDADGNKTGYRLAEGSAFFLLEEEGHARARGAHIYAEVVGTGVTHSCARSVKAAATSLERAARASFGGASILPDAVFGDGLGEPGQDAIEAEVLRSLAPDGPLPFLSTVAQAGFAGAATGLFSLLHATAALKDGDASPQKTARHHLVWTSDRGSDHVAVTLRQAGQGSV